MTDSITIRKPFDAHVHVRDGAMLKLVAPMTARQFWGAIVMPNLVPPITTLTEMREYRHRIYDALRGERDVYGFKPFMTCYLTEALDLKDLEWAFKSRVAVAVKYYPHGATTNSDSGVRNLKNVMPTLHLIEELGMPLLLHAETNIDKQGNEIDPYDREKVFLEETAPWLLETFPRLKISVEHVSSCEAVAFIEKHGHLHRLVCTVTPHHLLLDRRDVFRGGLNPHLHCWPTIKTSRDRDQLRKFATAGHSFVFLGTDSAPHPTTSKERAECCAGGVFCAHAALELYAEVFEEENALGNFEAFASLNGPSFYGIEVSRDTVTLVKRPWRMATAFHNESGEQLRPLFFSEKPTRTIPWRASISAF